MTALNAFLAWLFRWRGPEAGPVVLGHRRIFVLPTRAGLLYGACVLLMLLGSINYQLSLGFAMTFLLAGVGLVGMLHAFRNLARLRLTPLRCEPVFAGEMARFAVDLDNARRDARHALRLRCAGAQAVSIDVPAAGSARVALAVPATRRGYFRSGRMVLDTRYPLGLVRAWSHIEPDVTCLVYPAPERRAPPPPQAGQQESGTRRGHAGSDDFSGLRGHLPSDSPRHIAWKAVAREGVLKTKQFSGDGSEALWLDWFALPGSLDVEARLARLTRWVIDAQQAGRRYALRLPRREFPPAEGEQHLRACLHALALFET